MAAQLSNKLQLSFSDRSLLRGVPAGALVRRDAEVFESSTINPADGAALHAVSQQVQELDVFVSHSWRTSRFDKLWALLLYFNATAATVAMLTASVLIALLESTGHIPQLLPIAVPLWGEGSNTGWWYNSGMPPAVAMVVAVLVLRFWQKAVSSLSHAGLRVRPHRCFLDKLCIDQRDEQRKSKGIACLGAFLAHSRTLLVLFEPGYFSRLWCCYELAAFRRVQRPHQSLAFLPVSLPRFLAVILLMQSASVVPSLIYRAFTTGARHAMLSVELGHVPCMPFAVVMARRYHKERQAIDSHIASFSIAHAKCFDSHDRERVESNIIDWFGDGHREQGLAAFDAYVRTSVRQAMEEQLGVRALPFRYCFLTAMPYVVQIPGGFCYLHLHEWPVNAIIMLCYLSCLFLCAPLLVPSIMWIGSWSLWDKGPLHWCAGLVATLMIQVGSFCLALLSALAPPSERLLYMHALVSLCVLLPFNLWTFQDSWLPLLRSRS